MFQLVQRLVFPCALLGCKPATLIQDDIYAVLVLNHKVKGKGVDRNLKHLWLVV